MSRAFLHDIVHDDLGYRKVCSTWVPWQLSHNHKHAWHTICQEHLDHHVHEGDAFLHQIVTGDESWVYHYEQESKRQSMQWKHLSFPANKKFKTQPSTGKVMLTIFLDVNGLYWCTFRKRVKLSLVLDTVTF
jgi:histone-lysine N-methyltransferase SETMAR